MQEKGTRSSDRNYLLLRTDAAGLDMNSSLSIPPTTAPQSNPADLARLSLLLAGAIIVSLAGLLGGMQYVIIVLALGLAILIMRKPQEAIPAGWLFMLAAMTLLPVTARLHYLDIRTEGIDWQQYYWAAGSLIVLLAALYRVGISSVLHAPASLKAFLLVAITSSIFGYFRGNEVSYVIRQLYGSILFVLYFVIAWVVGNEELLFRRLKGIAPLVALTLFVYYVSVFSQFGFHKEDTSVTSQLGLVATFLFVKGVIERRSSWLAPSVVVLGASTLFFFRHVFLGFLFAIALALAMRNASRIRRQLCFGIAALILLPSMFPSGAQFVVDTVEEKAPELFGRLPESTGTRDAASMLVRYAQLGSAAAALMQSPLFGYGMGSNLQWYDPDEKYVEQPFVDNAWAYLLVKMGFAGILAFCWVLVTLLRCMSRRSLAISICLLTIFLIGMISEPLCFQFTTSPIAGALAGILYAKKYPLSLPSPVKEVRVPAA
jgi:hypothetical protein